MTPFDFHDTVPVDPPPASFMPLETHRAPPEDDGLWVLIGIVGALLCVLGFIAVMVAAS